MNMDWASFQAQLDDEAAAAIVADLFRPGWTDYIVHQSAPGIHGAHVFRGFTLERPTSFAAYAHVQWDLMVLMPTPLAVPFVWTNIVRDLDRWHTWVFRQVRATYRQPAADDRV